MMLSKCQRLITFKVFRTYGLIKEIPSDFLYQARCTQNFKYEFQSLLKLRLQYIIIDASQAQKIFQISLFEISIFFFSLISFVL